MADLIDRDALIAEYDRVHVGAPGGARKLMQDAPAVNRWIPCSERLPEDNAEVLVSFCRRYVKIGYIEPGDGLRYWVIPGHTVAPLNYIEAWMPMPDAYEPTEKE